ncbi:heterokaryon incompatibility protein-domain-containing protein [Xylariaceae sp. FL1019]|nr:heterokaryon incompatibility protein-domain-containing protein [Xylariaceae sp. FL1019]
MSSDQEIRSHHFCSICFRYENQGILFTQSHNGISSIVHQTCSECDSSEVQETQLCELCSHVRLSHLLTCGWPNDIDFPSKSDKISTSLELGTSTQLKARESSCTFCRWCLQVLKAEFDLRRKTLHELGEVTIVIARYRERHFKTTIDLSFGPGTFPRWVDSIELGYRRSAEDFVAVPSCVDWDTVRDWRAVCEKEHTLCRRIGSGRLPETLRLIDVEAESVIDANFSPYSKYIALSYVWGTDSSIESTTHSDNLDILKTRGSLRSVLRTVRHAMDACKQLGYRYLWVDRLCIVQDDAIDKHGQIRSMDAIFSHADLVIVAACGDSIHSGLPANQLPPFQYAVQGVWNQRGWTYQEAVLAKCKLYFTTAELWFECAEGIQRESTLSGNTKSGNTKQTHLRLQSHIGTKAPYDNFEDYSRHLENYSGRVLSYPSDVYNAFQGIETTFYPGSESIFGLPEPDFSRALLWCPVDTGHVCERQSGDKDVLLPSWSWASVEGKIWMPGIFQFQYHQRYTGESDSTQQAGSFYCSLCEWETLITAGCDGPRTRKINSTNDDIVWVKLDKIWADCFESFRECPDCRQVLALAVAQGCVETDVPTDLLSLPTDSFVPLEKLRSRWPTVKAFWADVRCKTRRTEDLTDRIHLGPGQLRTRTQCAELRIEYSALHDGYVVRNVSDGIGALLGTEEYRLRRSKSPDEPADVDFIALAVGIIPLIILSYQWNGSCGEYAPQPGVIVMAVRWDGPIARRIALGWVTLQGWVESDPAFRTVILA